MPSKQCHDEKPMDREELLRAQREANQALVLSALRASEQVDDALAARARAEQEVLALKTDEHELRATAAFRERMIGIIGHDLRTPLNTILIASGLVASRGTLDAADADLLARIVRSCQRMARMIGELSDFTRARLGGGFTLVLGQADLGAICRDIVEDIRITTDVPLRLVTNGDLSGVWDADRLVQALSNIVSNAIDHAAPGTAVSIHARAEGRWVTLEITNAGQCIPPELLPVIFCAFRRAQTGVGERSGHLGLGLFVASEITQAHGGTLEVRSSEGSTTFTMALPRSSVSN
ncbi:MAG TPA: HAMP domain-containing sensor histidine kinase [Polyangiales bacterium]